MTGCSCQPKPNGEAPDLPHVDCPIHGARAGDLGHRFDPDTPAPTTLVDLMADAIDAKLNELGADTAEDYTDEERRGLVVDLATAALDAGRPPERPIIADTDNGQLALLRIPGGLAEPPRCDACPDTDNANIAGVAVRLRLGRFREAAENLIHLCGSCVARGLAYSLATGRGLTDPHPGVGPDGADGPAVRK